MRCIDRTLAGQNPVTTARAPRGVDEMLLRATKEEIDAQPLRVADSLVFMPVHLAMPGAYALDFVFRTTPSQAGQQEPLVRLRIAPEHIKDLVDTLTAAMKAAKDAATPGKIPRH